MFHSLRGTKTRLECSSHSGGDSDALGIISPPPPPGIVSLFPHLLGSRSPPVGCLFRDNMALNRFNQVNFSSLEPLTAVETPVLSQHVFCLFCFFVRSFVVVVFCCFSCFFFPEVQTSSEHPILYKKKKKKKKRRRRRRQE